MAANELTNTYTDIYVNLNRTTSASSIIDGNGVVICNNYTKTGNINNPLTFRQFREYLRHDHNLNQIFYLSGALSFDITDSSDKGLLGNNILIETPHSGKIIRITNWKNESNITQQPWTVVVNSTDGVDTIWFTTNNDDVEISNAQIEVSGSPNRINFGVNTLSEVDISIESNNTLRLINNKFYGNKAVDLNNGIHTFEFFNYNDVIANYCLFNNMTTSGSISIRNDFVEKCEYTFLNSLFVRIDEIVGAPNESQWTIIKNDTSITFDNLKIYFNTDNCVFSQATSAFGDLVDDPYYTLLYEGQGTNIYDWAIASACDESLLTLAQEINFDYLDADWLTITLSGTPTNPFNNLGNYTDTVYVFSKVRDGIGPLTFNKMPGVVISATSGVGVVDEVITYINKDASYDTTYSPSRYDWAFGDGMTSSTSGGEVDHTYTAPNIYPVRADIYSYNNWYSSVGYGSRAVNAALADFDIYIFTTSSDCFSEFFVSATEAYTFDEITISAVNISTYDTNVEIYTSWGEDFGDTYLNPELYNKHNTGIFGYPEGTFDESYRYISSGTYSLYFAAKQADGKTIYKTKTLSVSAHTQDVYYVDLLEGYDADVWWDKETVIGDDFESGVFDTGWYHGFKSGYQITDMWDEKVAVSIVGATPTSMIPTLVDNNFNFEFSFNRSEKDFNVAFNIKTQFDNVLKVEWDYIGDRINVYYLNETVRTIKYDLNKYGLLRDLRCPNSLRVLKIRIENETPENSLQDYGLKIYYSMDGTNWIDSGLFDYTIAEYITSDYNRLVLEAIADSTTGFGYLRLQSKCGLPYVSGAITYPLTYAQFKERIEINGKGDYNDKYLCKNYRKITDLLRMDHNKYFEIDAWDLTNLGPWMLIINYHVGEPYDLSEDISFAGARISNGILYNIKEATDNLKQYAPNLRLSFAYDMYIVWQGNANINQIGVVRLYPSKWMEQEMLYADTVGSTIKSELGFIDVDGA